MNWPGVARGTVGPETRLPGLASKLSAGKGKGRAGFEPAVTGLLPVALPLG